jgi:undecaprenyl pyrophosphate phosphatase UppP
MRTRSRVIGADTVHEQAVFNAAMPTYYVLADAVAFAANKHHLTIWNNAGSNQLISLKKLFHINLSLGAVTGVALRFDAKKVTALPTAGTDITAQSADSANPALTNVTIKTNATVTEGALMWPITTQNDELTAANTAVANYLMQLGNLAIEGVETQEWRLRPGEGLTIKQITSSTVGSFAWLAVVTVEPTV